MHTPGKAIIQHFKGSPQLCIEVPYWERADEGATHPTFIATIYGPHPEEDAQRIASGLNSNSKLLEALEKISAFMCPEACMDDEVCEECPASNDAEHDALVESVMWARGAIAEAKGK